MALKTNITVDVDAADFSAFFTKYMEYKAALANTPDAWKDVAASANVSKDAYEKAAQAAKSHADDIDAATSGVGKLRQASDAAARSWHTISRDTGTALKNIVGMTESLLKWTGLTGIVSGIAGGFGFSDLARNVSSQRTTALATNTTPGNLAAANIAYSRFIGSGSATTQIQKIAAMQRDPAQAPLLAQLLGMSVSQVEAADPADLLGPMLQRGHAAASGMTLQQMGQTPYLSQSFDPSTLNILHGNQLSDQEYANAQKTYRNSKPGLSPNNPKAWQDFVQVLDTAETTIKTAFVDRLTALTGPLTKLTDEFSTALVKVINSDAFGDAIAALNKGTEWLAHEVEKPEFRTGIDNFITMLSKVGPILGTLASDLVAFARKLGFDVDVPESSAGDSFRGLSRTAGGGKSPSASDHANDTTPSGATHANDGSPSASGPPDDSSVTGGGRAGDIGLFGRKAAGGTFKSSGAGMYGVPGAVLDLEAFNEAGGFPGGGYNTQFGGRQADLTHMTLAQVMRRPEFIGHEDAGRWQETPGFIKEVMGPLGLTPNTIFTPEVQKKIAAYHAAHEPKSGPIGRFISIQAHPWERALLAKAWDTPDRPAEVSMEAHKPATADHPDKSPAAVIASKGSSVGNPSIKPISLTVSGKPGASTYTSAASQGSLSGAQQ